MNPAAAEQAQVFCGRLEAGDEVFAAPADQSLFESLRRAGLDWPVSCRNGTCRTCIGRLAAGQVAYDIPWPGLSLEEKHDGYCLPCIARPLTDFVLQRS